MAKYIILHSFMILISFYDIASEASYVYFFAYRSLIFDLFYALKTMLRIKINLFTS